MQGWVGRLKNENGYTRRDMEGVGKVIFSVTYFLNVPYAILSIKKKVSKGEKTKAVYVSW